MYQVGFPLWRWSARRGAALMLQVQVTQDEDAGGYLATSPNLPGFLVHARTQDSLLRNVYDCASQLVVDELGQTLLHPLLIAWDGVFQQSAPMPTHWRQEAFSR